MKQRKRTERYKQCSLEVKQGLSGRSFQQSHPKEMGSASQAPGMGLLGDQQGGQCGWVDWMRGSVTEMELRGRIYPWCPEEEVETDVNIGKSESLAPSPGLYSSFRTLIQISQPPSCTSSNRLFDLQVKWFYLHFITEETDWQTLLSLTKVTTPYLAIEMGVIFGSPY